MTFTRSNGAVSKAFTGLFALASLLAGVASLPASERAASALTDFKPVPLPKLSSFEFPTKLNAPKLRFLTETEVTSVAVEARSDVVIDERSFDERDILGGVDNRVVVHNTSFPYSAIGRVLWSDGSYCTGTLVGDRVVATASHCVPWGQPSISMIFQPDFYDTNVFPSATVTDVAAVYQQTTANFDSSACGLQKDFAVLKLSAVLSGTVGGYFSVTTGLTNSLVHEGYPSDLANGARPYQQTGLTASVVNSLKCDNFGPLSTTADAAGGQSGGPLYIPQIKAVVGVLSAGTAASTVFASGTGFTNLVSWARTNWPA